MTAISEITAQSQILMYLFPSLSSWFSLPILPPNTVCRRFSYIGTQLDSLFRFHLDSSHQFQAPQAKVGGIFFTYLGFFQGTEYMQWPMLPQGGDSHKLLSAFSCLATGDLYLKSDRNIPQERKGMPQIRNRSDLKRWHFIHSNK